MKRIAILSLLSAAVCISLLYALPSAPGDPNESARVYADRVWRALPVDPVDCRALGTRIDTEFDALYPDERVREFVEDLNRLRLRLGRGAPVAADWEPLTVPPGALYCGRLQAADGPAVRAIARTHAFDLASTGVPLLELEPWRVPPTQLVGSPGFAEFPDVLGFDVVGYVIERHRVGVWTGGDLVVISFEPTGPFPEIIPADETGD